MRINVAIIFVCLALGAAHAQNLSNIQTGLNGSLGGWVPSPHDAWHTDISASPVDSNSANIISLAQDLNATAGIALHPDFGSGAGIPYVVVDSAAGVSFVDIGLTDPGDDDQTVYPMSATTPEEGATTPGTCWTDSGDHHALVLDKATGLEYETYQAKLCNNAWNTYGGVVWDLTNPAGEQRPYGMSSVDASGLSVFEGLIRYDEVQAAIAAGNAPLAHAIRFTAAHTKCGNYANGMYGEGQFTAPATHAACNLGGTDNIMGMRIRLKSSFDVSGYSPENQVILNTMKKRGMILTDNGSTGFFQGTEDARWNDSDLAALKNVAMSNFEVVQMGPVFGASKAPTGAAPTVTLLSASAGTGYTITPTVTGGTYGFYSTVPGSGPVTAASGAAYNYTARNLYGSSSAAVTAGSATQPATPPAGILTGTVTFYDGTTVLGTGTLTNGVATYSFSPAAGTHTITAQYSGSATATTSTSAPVTVTVTIPLAPTTTTVTPSAGTVVAGQPVVLTAAVQ